MKLYIIGNGFDLHHNLPTNYFDYSEWLESNDYETLRAFENCEYLSVDESDERWTSLEECLTLNYEDCMDYAVSNYYPDVMAENNVDWSGIGIELELITKFVDKFLGVDLYTWLSEISLSDVTTCLPLLGSDKYITFNYTMVLEECYQIPNCNVLHIHGTVHDRNIQFGSTENDAERIGQELEKTYGEDDFYGASIQYAVQEVEDYCRKAYKCLESNFDKITKFTQHDDITEIVVIGHSFDGIDEPYYSEYLIPKYKSCVWTFYCYKDSNREEAFASQYGLPSVKYIIY